MWPSKICVCADGFAGLESAVMDHRQRPKLEKLVKQQVRTLSSPTACNTEQDHRRLEVRLDRGILHGNKCPATQVDGHFPSERRHTAIESVCYGIVHENNRLATLATDSSVLE